MKYLVNALASNEVHVAKYYLKREAWVAAANRAKEVLKTYPEAPALEEALAIMVIAYDKLKLTDLRDDAQRVLTLNFPNSKYDKGVSTEGKRGIGSGEDFSGSSQAWRQSTAPEIIVGHRSRKLSLVTCISGLRKYSITRRVPILTSTVTAMPGVRRTVLFSTLSVFLVEFYPGGVNQPQLLILDGIG